METLEAAALKAANAMERAHGQAVAAAVNGYAKVTGAAGTAATAQINGVNRVATATKSAGDSAAAQADRNLRTAVKDAAAKEKLIDREKQAVGKAVKAKESAEQEAYARNLKIAVKDAAAKEALIDREVAAVKRAANAKEQAELGPSGRLAKLKRTARSEEELGAAAYNRHMDSYHQQRIKEIQKQRYGTNSAFEEAIMNATGLGTAMTAAGAATAGVAAIVAGLGALSQGYHKIRAEAEAAAEATLIIRKGLRVESALKGRESADNQGVQEALAFRAATGLDANDASELTRKYLSSLPSGIQKGNITSEVGKGLMSQVGVLQSRFGGAAGARGDLAGLLGQFTKIGSVEQGLGQMEAIRIGLTEGRGDDSPLTSQLLKTAGSIVKEGGAVGSLPEMAALIGVTSLTAGPEESGTRAEQINRALRAGLTKQSKAKGAVEPQAAYLKGLGIKETDSMEAALDKLIPDLQRAEKGGRDVGTYMAEHGFRNFEERRALADLVPNFSVFKQRMAKARSAQNGAEVLAANRRYLASPEGQNAVAEQLGDAATVTKGLPSERYNALKKAAAASPEVLAGDQSIVTTVGGDYLGGLLMGELPFIGDPKKAGREFRVGRKALSDLQAQAIAAGVTKPELEKARHASYGAPDYEAEYVNRVQGLIGAKGGDLSIHTQATMSRLADAIEASNRIETAKGDRTPPTPAAIPFVRPAAGPAH